MQIRDEHFRLISEHEVPKKERVKVISCRTSGKSTFSLRFPSTEHIVLKD